MSTIRRLLPAFVALLLGATALLVIQPATAGAGGDGGISHASVLNAVHMELKDASGNIVCSAYNTAASSRPRAHGCDAGTFTELLFNGDWDQISRRSVTLTEYPGGPPSTLDRLAHTGAHAAVHMELKDSGGRVVCHAYNTSGSSKPTAIGCPLGRYTELLFDSNWKEMSRRSVSVFQR